MIHVICVCSCVYASTITHALSQIVEWTKCVVRKLDDDFNYLVRLLLFDDIKASLKVG